MKPSRRESMNEAANLSAPPGVKSRKEYRKPEIERVVLVLGEAVLVTGCKRTTGSGPANPCATVFGGVCISAGS
jgi:hypothetical protein